MACNGPVHYRRATVDDAAGIAEVHLGGWQRAYAELVPQAFLDCKSGLGRVDFWRSELELEAAERKPWVALSDEQVIGFADGGIARDDDLGPRTGEVYTLFVTPECWERGIRSQLVEHVARDLREREFHQAVFWVLSADQAMRAFAEYLGWRPDGATRRVECGGVEVEELRYARRLFEA
jgi:L-amino acid N-acyltransferase YncA